MTAWGGGGGPRGRRVSAGAGRLWWAIGFAVVYVVLAELAAYSRVAELGFAAVVGCLAASGACAWFGWRTEGAERGWRLLIAAALVIQAAEVWAGIRQQRHGVLTVSDTSVSSVFSLVAALLEAAALVTFPSGGGSGWQRAGAAVRGQSGVWYRTVVLDGLTVVGSLLLLLWATVLREVFATIDATFAWTIGISGLFADCLLIVIVVLVAAFRDPHSRAAWALLGAGILANSSSTLAAACLIATGQMISSPVLFAGTVLAPLMFAIAAAATARPPAGAGAAGEETMSRRATVRLRFAIRAHTFLPYVLVGGSVAGLALRGLISGLAIDRVEMAIGATLLGLVIVRQLLVVTDNANLVARVRESQHQLRYQAFHDSLTGLPNREMFHDHLTRLTRRHAEAARPFALLYLDLDGFKDVNDAFGHDAGDAVLKVVAQRLQACVRPGDLPARLGGDEFAVLFDSRDEPTAAADRVLAACRAPMRVGHHTHTVGASAGLLLARATDAPADPETVLRQADDAMYGAKARGKGVVEAVHLHQRPREPAWDLHRDLALALGGDPHAGTVDVHYQPIVELPSGRLHALEALARWTHPTRGDVPPATFIPSAEAAGLIETLDSAVLDRACADIAHLRTHHPDAPLLHVNVSGALAAHQALIDTVRDCLHRHHLLPSALVLEITETERIADMPAAADVLTRLSASGVRIALDDLGAGHTTLEALQQLPLGLLKLDRQLIRGADDPRPAALLHGVMAIARRLDIPVIAEGIETPTDLAAATRIACHYGQGYLYGEPQPLPSPARGRPLTTTSLA